MAKRTKQQAPTKAQPSKAQPAPVVTAQPAPVVTAQPAPVVTQVASTATKLTKRNNVQLANVLVTTAKAPRSRAKHVVAAWQQVVAALPATAAHLCTLPALANPACVSPQAYISYMLRRGHLMPKA